MGASLRLLSLSLLLLSSGVGCQPAPPTDRELYIQALGLPPGDAVAVCGAVQDTNLRGDCTTATVMRLIEAGQREAAETLCGEIDNDVWRSECWFSVVDTAALVGKEASMLCARSGRYEVHCRKHALEREAFALPIEVGEEADGAVQIGRMVSILQPRAKRQARRLMANRILGQRVSIRWEEAPFDPVLCGVVPPGLCRYAYWYSVSHLRGEITTVCAAGQPTPPEATVAGGMSGFTPDGAAIAQAVWAETCAQVAAGEADPMEIGALEPSLPDQDMMTIRPPDQATPQRGPGAPPPR